MEIKSIPIPQDWTTPRIAFGKYTQQGLIIGMRYYPFDSYLGREYGEGWRYILLSDKEKDEENYYTEDEIAPLEPGELRKQLQEEIAKKLREIELLTQELKAIPSVNGLTQQ